MSPGFGDLPGFWEASEPVLVQALVPEASVETLAGTLLYGVSWLDEVLSDPSLVVPLIEHPAGELRPVVGDENL